MNSFYDLSLGRCRNPEEAMTKRKAFASKTMPPKSVQENMENFNGVTDDFIKRLKNLPGNNDHVIVVNNLLPHLFEWSTECKNIK